ncbi:MAG: hypothetical protein RH948_04150 [Cyclobacteriaceae bacterium]
MNFKEVYDLIVGIQLHQHNHLIYRVMDQACVRLALAETRHERPDLLMPWRVDALNARGQKNFHTVLFNYIDTQGSACAKAAAAGDVAALGPEKPACAKPLRQRQARP